MWRKKQPKNFFGKLLAMTLRDVETRVLKEGPVTNDDTMTPEEREKRAKDAMQQRPEDGFEYDETEIERRRRTGRLDYEGGGQDYEVNKPRPKANMSQLARSFEDAGEVNEKEARHRMRKLDAYSSLLKGLANRAEPTGKVEFITIEKANALMEEYKQAKEEGFVDKDLDIVPLSSYHAKLFPEGKKAVRPLLENEWGVIQNGNFAGTVLCIRDRDLGVGAGGPTVTVGQRPVKPDDGLLPGPGEDR